MKRICRDLQERLADAGAQALREDALAQSHLEECTECFQVLEGLARLDESLATMPALDAPDAAVAALLAQVAAEGAAPAASERKTHWLAALWKPRWGFAPAVASAFTVLFVSYLAFHSKRSLLSQVPDVPRPAVVADRSEAQQAAQAPSPARPMTSGPVTYTPPIDNPRGHATDIPQETALAATVRTVNREEIERLGALGYIGSDQDRRRKVEEAKKHAGTPTAPPADKPAAHRDAGTFAFSPPAKDEVTSKLKSATGPANKEDANAPSRSEAAHAPTIPEPVQRDYEERKRLAGKTGEKQADSAGEYRAAQELPASAVANGAVAGNDRGVPASIEGGVPGGVAGGVVGGLPDALTPLRSIRVGGQIKAPKKLKDVAPVFPDLARRARVQGVVILDIRIGATGKVEQATVVRGIPLLDAAALDAVKQWVYAPTLMNGVPVPVSMTVVVTFDLAAPLPTASPVSDLAPSEPARAFLAERTSIEGLPFQPTSGYWANTYLPGDPALRFLQARLRGWDRSLLATTALRLHDAALPPAQPFDAPSASALGLYLHADRRGIDGPGRVLLQIGLRGSPRIGQKRPPMNVAVVLDLRGDVPVDVAAGMRALALAFAQAKEVGDRFRLIVAGRPGGIAVGADSYKHGPLVVALDRLLANDAAGDGLDLPEAMSAALAELSLDDAPDAALGSSAVVLVTGQPLGDATVALCDLAHQGALAGIPTSVVGVGSGSTLAEIDRLALSGQGSRRLLAARADAARLVDSELAAAGNVVARAVRLRIRLAPGVRLVEVIGSHRLDDAQAERVRQVEQSLDQRLARHLGIEADRGQDEDGIQIVIPAFQAGDAHAILLDVVAPGPGELVDVSVRYKDLVALGNGAARASLVLPRGTLATNGPLERNVLKNLLAFRVSQTLACAGAALGAGDTASALGQLEAARGLLAGVGPRVPGLAGDPDLLRDAAMLREYAVLLATNIPPQQRLLVADSLRYAGRLKLLPRPAPLVADAL